jgi:hypothetical protein
LADELHGYTTTKSGLRFGVDRALPKTLAERLIRAAVVGGAASAIDDVLASANRR